MGTGAFPNDNDSQTRNFLKPMWPHSYTSVKWNNCLLRFAKKKFRTAKDSTFRWIHFPTLVYQPKRPSWDIKKAKKCNYKTSYSAIYLYHDTSIKRSKYWQILSQRSTNVCNLKCLFITSRKSKKITWSLVTFQFFRSLMSGTSFSR